MYRENSCCLRLAIHKTERTCEGRKRPRARESTWHATVVMLRKLAENRVQTGSRREMIRKLGPNWVQIAAA